MTKKQINRIIELMKTYHPEDSYFVREIQKIRIAEGWEEKEYPDVPPVGTTVGRDY